MQRKTIARVGEALIHGESPFRPGVDRKNLDGWVRKEGSRLVYDHLCGSVIGISIKRESIAWTIAGVRSPVAEGRLDAPILPLHGEPATIDELREYLKTIFHEISAELPTTKVGAVGVAFPGLVGPKGIARDYPLHRSLVGGPKHRSNPPLPGIVRKAMKDVGLSPKRNAQLAERPEIEIINDADADLLYESRRGVAKGVANVLCLKVCGGIGMGILFNRQLVKGSTSSAGDIEHFKVRADLEEKLKSTWGKLKDLDDLDECGCTGSECIGRFASGAAIVEQLSGYLPAPPDQETELTPNERGRSIEREATTPVVTDVCGRAGKLLGQALLGPTLAFDPEMIVISAFPRNEHLLKGIQNALLQGTPVRVDDDNITLSTEGIETTAAGAAQFALESVVVPRVEDSLRGSNRPFRSDLPAWIRMQIPGGKDEIPEA
jgi:predicted NBD/HSP70 family sugar kinase